MKRLKHVSETLEKTPEKRLKTIANIHDICVKHNINTLATYA
jgi:hypothetical protein